MKLTNNLNLPQTVVSAIQRNPYIQVGDISVTGLIQPPRIRQLTSRYREEMTVDVSDRMWALFGQMFHYVLEKADTDNGIVEERLSTDINGWKVTGQADLYEDGVLYDYKFTTIWSYVYGLKIEWEAQCNMYAQILRDIFPVKELKIIMGLRDWVKRNSDRKDYPDSQIVMVNVPMWKPEDVHEYMVERVTYHQEAESLPDKELPLCTSAERWEKPTTYAVKVKGQKRAKRVLESMEDAEAWAEQNMKKEFEIEVRQGESVRCESYCDCSNFCDFTFNKLFKGGK